MIQQASIPKAITESTSFSSTSTAFPIIYCWAVDNRIGNLNTLSLPHKKLQLQPLYCGLGDCWEAWSSHSPFWGLGIEWFGTIDSQKSNNNRNISLGNTPGAHVNGFFRHIGAVGVCVFLVSKILLHFET